jgi:hypothetical protein
MEAHLPNQELLKREPDFRVRYRFYTAEEGGRWAPVYQGLRSDFWYSHEEHSKGMNFMIWPEFEDENGDVIIEKHTPVALTGTARMWIISKNFIDFHRGKIRIGTKGFFKEGNKNIAACEVTELLNIKL